MLVALIDFQTSRAGVFPECQDEFGVMSNQGCDGFGRLVANP